MDSWAIMVGLTAMFFAWLGEKASAGVYLWLSILFFIIFALRMGEPMFYMATAAVIGVFAYRTYYGREDVRDSDSEES